MTLRKLIAVAATVTAASSLAGCVSLLPKAKPSQLYRFGVAATSNPTEDAGGRQYNIRQAGSSFNRAAAGDRILTTTGAEAAYVAQSRWVSPAAVLFDDATDRVFGATPGCARLTSRGDPTPADAVLRLDVRTFEVRYLDGPEAPPTAVVEAQMTLTRSRDREIILDRSVQVQERAAENRVSSMVAALDAATSKVLSEIATAANLEAAQEGCGVQASGAAAVPAGRSSTTTTTTRTRSR